jgi:hypothetical protein
LGWGGGGDGHELCIARSPQQGMVRPDEVSNLKSEGFHVKVCLVTEGHRKVNLI